MILADLAQPARVHAIEKEMKRKNATLTIKMDFEIAKAKATLEAAKNNFESFLRCSYNETEKADKTYAYLEQAVDKVSKRKPLKIEFLGGGDLCWYAGIFSHLAQWMEAEDALNDLLTKQLDAYED